MRLILVFAALWAALAFAVPTRAQTSSDEDHIGYRVRKGDTLIDLARDYMRRPGDYVRVQRLNRIADPRRLPTGRTIRFPRDLLKFKAIDARFVSARGQVSRDGRPVTRGDAVAEGALVVTGPGSFATIGLADGSHLSLPSNSGIRVVRLRRILLTDTIDHLFALDKGEARGKVRKLEKPDDRWRIRSKSGVSAVRGTDFQVRIAETATFSEVFEGNVAVTPSSAATAMLAEGQGAAVSVGAPRVAQLLPAPELTRPGKVQADPSVAFTPKPQAGAGGWRVQIGADAGLLDRLFDVRLSGPVADVGPLPDGKYFVKVSALATDGFEGLPVTYAFKRRLNSVSASASKGDDGYAFKWLGEGAGVRRYRFQLFRESTNGVAVVDEPGLTTDVVRLSDLTPGTWYWRVGATQFVEGEAETNWTEFEKLIVAAAE